MTRVHNERLWIIGAVVVALLMTVVGYFLLIGPQRSRTAAVRDDVSASTFQATSLRMRITSLTTQNKQMSTYRAALTRARQALPTTGDLTATPRLLRSLAGTATATSTSITSVTVGTPAPVAATTPTSAATTAAAAPAAAAGATSGLSSIAIGATITGSLTHLNAFLSDLQAHQPRALLVTAVTIAPGASSGVTSMNITASAFVRSG